MAKTRFVIANPGFEFFPTLNAWTEQVCANSGTAAKGGVLPSMSGESAQAFYFRLTKDGSNVFSMLVIDGCKDGFVADIDDPSGLLDTVRKGSKALVELRSNNRDPERSLLAGPFPVIDGAVLFDALDARVCCRANLELLDLKRPAYEDSGVSVGDGSFSFSMKEVDEELSGRGSRIVGNYSYDDLAVAANDLYMELPPDWNGKRADLLPLLCGRMEDVVGRREADLEERCLSDGFLDDSFKAVLADERRVVDAAGGLKGLRRPRGERGVVLGGAEGYDVAVRKGVKGPEDGYVVFLRDGKAESYQNAVRRDPGMAGVLSRVFAQAQRRDRNIRRYEKFCSAVSGEGRSRKIR